MTRAVSVTVAPVALLDAGQHRFVGERPYAHRPLEPPVLRSHPRLEHHCQAFPRVDVGRWPCAVEVATTRRAMASLIAQLFENRSRIVILTLPPA